MQRARLALQRRPPKEMPPLEDTDFREHILYIGENGASTQVLAALRAKPQLQRTCSVIKIDSNDVPQWLSSTPVIVSRTEGRAYIDGACAAFIENFVSKGAAPLATHRFNLPGFRTASSWR